MSSIPTRTIPKKRQKTVEDCDPSLEQAIPWSCLLAVRQKKYFLILQDFSPPKFPNRAKRWPVGTIAPTEEHAITSAESGCPKVSHYWLWSSQENETRQYKFCFLPRLFCPFLIHRAVAHTHSHLDDKTKRGSFLGLRVLLLFFSFTRIHLSALSTPFLFILALHSSFLSTSAHTLLNVQPMAGREY